MLAYRRQQVLAALIHEYVAHALPVASRTLVQGYPLGVSSATVRNDLSALEEGGYIKQPHTSAGRIPTDSGYRQYVDSLFTQEKADEDADMAEAMRGLRETMQALRETTRELDELLAQTAAELTRLTSCLSLVLPVHSASVPLGRIGLSALAQQPEFHSSLMLLPLLRMLEDNSLVVHIEHTAGPDEPTVSIGHENGDEALGNISIVASHFTCDGTRGIVAVVGPTRMDYERAIRAVQSARSELDSI